MRKLPLPACRPSPDRAQHSDVRVARAAPRRLRQKFRDPCCRRLPGRAADVSTQSVASRFRAELPGARALAAGALAKRRNLIIMLAIEFEQLSALGLTPALANRAAGTGHFRGRGLGIAARHRGTSQHDRRARRSRRTQRPSAAAAGARVERGRHGARRRRLGARRRDAYGEMWIEARVPPSSHIARRDGDGRVHPIVSNVDTALLLMGLDDDFNPRRLERYLALVHDDAIMPVVVLTKADVPAPTPESLDERLALLDGRVPPHVEVFAVNAMDAPPLGRCTAISGVDRPSCCSAPRGQANRR